MTFNMDGYVDVAERIKVFADKFPEGSLQSELERVDGGWLCKAYAYRSAEDSRPGVGHAFEPVPGKTPYTKDSEAMNAETSAWGRAIVALGFETKKIASANEVRARQSGGEPTGGAAGTAQPAAQREPAPSSAAEPSPSQFKQPNDLDKRMGQAPAAPREVPDDGGDAGSVLLTFGKHKGKRVREAPREYLNWWVKQDPPTSADLRRQQGAARIFLGVDTPAAADDGIPF